MSEQIAIRHQDFSASQLADLISAKSMSVRRGVHVGNQESHAATIRDDEFANVSRRVGDRLGKLWDIAHQGMLA